MQHRRLPSIADHQLDHTKSRAGENPPKSQLIATSADALRNVEALSAHAKAKKRLRHDLRGVLLVFLAMQWTIDGAPSTEQAAAMLGADAVNPNDGAR